MHSGVYIVDAKIYSFPMQRIQVFSEEGLEPDFDLLFQLLKQ